MNESSTLLPTTAIEEYFRTLSNWGRWGDDDRQGALNLITPDVRAEAVKSVRDGAAVSLARDIDPLTPDPLHSGMAAVHRTTDVREVEKALGHKARWDAYADHINIAPHGGNAHLDGLAHYSWDDKYYNGFDVMNTTVEGGAVDLAVHHASEGIVTRGVLLDIAALHGVAELERGYAVTMADLLAAEERQRVRVRAGDALLIHTGSAAAILRDGPLFRTEDKSPLNACQSGLDASTLPFLRERDVAVMGADGTHDVQPPQYDDINFARPIHSVCLVAIGIWLMDNLDLTALARECEYRQQWDFLFTANPWRFVGSTSSPLNPVAIL